MKNENAVFCWFHEALRNAALSLLEKRLLRKPEEILAAANAALGQHGYHVLRNNCEHFSNQCAFGVHYSKQTDDLPDGTKLDMHRGE